MARRKKGLPIDGWLLIDKPAGYTSSFLVNKLKWLLKARKAGHAGTLDPAATGLLAVAFGEATKTIPYITNALKEYKFIVNLGSSTTTDDASGYTLESSGFRPSYQEIQQILGKFRGRILQTPPKVSAVKVNGRRAYKLVQEKKMNLVLAPRELWVKKLTLDEQIDESTIKMTMICGKGGYVRSIARDLGIELGCFAHVKNLRRISSGPFSIDESINFDILNEPRGDFLKENLLPITDAIRMLKKIECNKKDSDRLKNGQFILSSIIQNDEQDEFLLSHQDKPIAICKYYGGKIHPKRVFQLNYD